MKKNSEIKINAGDWISYLDDNDNLQITEVLRDYFYYVGDPIDCCYIKSIITKDGVKNVNQILDIQRVENRERFK